MFAINSDQLRNKLGTHWRFIDVKELDKTRVYRYVEDTCKPWPIGQCWFESELLDYRHPFQVTAPPHTPKHCLISSAFPVRSHLGSVRLKDRS